MRRIPTIQEFMTKAPIFVDKTDGLLHAAGIMQKNKIRHLPVLYDGKIEGILSETDVNLMRTIKNIHIEKLRVMDCFTPNPYCASPETPLDEVLTQMSLHKYGCAVIAVKDQLVGIFSWIDAIKAFVKILHAPIHEDESPRDAPRNAY